MTGCFVRIVLLAMFALGAVLYILGLGLQNHTGLFVTAVIAWVILALGALTFGNSAGKMVTAAASLTLTLIYVQQQFPGVWASARSLVSRADETVRDGVSTYTHKTPQRLPCDVRKAGGAFFDPRSGEPLVFYRLDEQDRVECFDAPGFHPITRDELKPVTPEVVSRILREAP
jgi:hypothetical protein